MSFIPDNPPAPGRGSTPSPRIAVLGLGYVGCVTAACFAELGAYVTGVERDAHKVRSIQEGRAPFFEPELDRLVAAHRLTGRLRATTDLAEALDGAEVAFICVGTPPDAKGDPALDQIERVCAEVATYLAAHPRRLLVVLRSTVFPDACEAIAARFRAAGVDAALVANPEFLREGSAVSDFLEPALVVVGGDDASAVSRVAELYRPLGGSLFETSLRTASMVKYACNAFHAAKVGFANEIGAVCTALGIDGHEVMAALCADNKLNTSPAYLKPGFAFGGSCLAKDLRALVNSAGRLGTRLPLLESVLPSNQEHISRALAAIAKLEGRIGLFGLAFKENTDDLRESPVVALLERLVASARQVRVYDPHVHLNEIYGSNRAYLLASIPGVESLVVDDFAQLLAWSDFLVVAQKPDAITARCLLSSGLPLLDLTGTLPVTARSTVVAPVL